MPNQAQRLFVTERRRSMLYQYLPPEERTGEHKYKRGEFTAFDDRPTEEQQRNLLELAQKTGRTLKHCLFCNRWMNEWDNKYCSQRCRNDAYLQRRQQRHEMQLTKFCLVCGKQFHAKRLDAKYCSDACKQSAYRQRTTVTLKGADAD